MQTLRIALAQINPLVGDIDGNAARIIAAAERARDEFRADAVLFPELCLTGYPPEDLLLRPGLHVRVLRALEEVKRRVAGITLIIGLPQQAAGGLFNAAVVLRDGQLLGSYHKQHLPNYSVFDEKRYFAAGSEPCVVALNGVNVGITICEDVWHPGPVAQAVAAGARLILNLNASPFHINKGREREEVVRARIKENGVPLVYVNQVGGQDELVFDGESFVMDEMGEVVLRAPAWQEGLWLAVFEVSEEAVRALPGAVAPLQSLEASVYDALVCGVRDYIEKNGFRGVVLGLSGGIDSALTLAVAVDAIGAARVEAVMMPSRYTAGMSVEDAAEEARILGVDYRVITIEPLFNAFLDSLREEFAGTTPDTTEENLQARCRGVLLMAISNKKRKIVLTTGNKSEMAVGYATLYGDMAGGFDVLKDVPKTLVFRLAEYRNSLAPVIPRRVIDRPPSAELAPDQKDTDSLPPYDILDAILERYVELDQCLEEIVAAGYDADTVRRVIRLVDRNEYKRRQAAPGVRITRRAFGRDRRYPITSGFGK
ncbi:NAD+ synthase [Sulfurivermis fontis]|uniref:NAD+ synthase n=1 Tax=Sulfurivermis fontis TaxID=1972068 RepID=UPI000FDB5DD3|nr:NAD+ synthase [Sulfurivermis fontis]